MHETTRSEPVAHAAGSQFERSVRRVRINVGALVSQDHGVGRWPGDDVDADMEFDAEWNGRWWDCRADGFGRLASRGEPGGYGNGSIFVHDHEGVTLLDDAPHAQVNPPSGAQGETR